MNKLFKTLGMVAVMGVATIVSTVGAQAARVNGTYTIGGEYTYTPPLTAGDELTVTMVAPNIVDTTGDFSDLIDGSFVAGADNTIELVPGFSNNTVTWSLTSLALGPIDFGIEESIGGSITSIRPLSFILFGTMSAVHNGVTSMGEFVFNGTTSNFGTGTFSFSAVFAPIPVPAALPLLIGGLGALGAVGVRRRRKAA